MINIELQVKVRNVTVEQEEQFCKYLHDKALEYVLSTLRPHVEDVRSISVTGFVEKENQNDA